MRSVKILLLLLGLALSAPTLAQRQKDAGKSRMTQEERHRIREDVDSARGAYDRRDRHRQERMAPAERERLRQDVQDANRQMRRDRR